jgi:Zn-finger nucleic acid-binding protein
MECPQCDGELNDLAQEDDHVFACSECGVLWTDGTRLNALLLHNTLPGLDSLGGRADPDAETGTCRSCGVSLTRIEHATRRNAMFETCEDCGFVLVGVDGDVPGDFGAANAGLVAFFKRFTAKR